MDTLVSYLLTFAVGGGILVNASMSAAYTVDLTIDTISPHFFALTPTGANRNFVLPDPAPELVGIPFLVSNTATSGGYSIPFRGKTLTTTGTLSSASTIGTVAPGASALSICYFDGTYYRWSYVAISATIPTSLGTLTEGITFAAGITKMLDASACATGEALIKIGDNLANALEIKEGSNSYVKLVSANGAEKIVAGQPVEVVTITATTSLSTDTIAERTPAAGVTVDGCLIKDGVAATAGSLSSGGVFSSGEVTGTGSNQNTAHGLGTTPSLAWAVVTDSGAGVFTITPGTHTSTNCVFSVSLGIKYRVYAIK